MFLLAATVQIPLTMKGIDHKNAAVVNEINSVTVAG